MRAQPRSASTFFTTVLILSSAAALGLPGTAEADPAIKYVTATTFKDSSSPKVIAAPCPDGWSVLGGAASIDGPQGQIAIQGAFPVSDYGIGYSFVAKAMEEHIDGTDAPWSLTAGAYCAKLTAISVHWEDSAFDSEPIKSVSATCPGDGKVLGMGGEVSTVYDSHPELLTSTLPVTTQLIFHGAEVDADLKQVTARAIELDAAVSGGLFAGSWKVTAVVVCEPPFTFDGLELRTNKVLGGGPLEFETDSRVEVSCSTKDRRIVAASSTIDDNDQGMWYLDRFGPLNSLVHNRGVAEAYRNPDLGTTLVRDYIHILCVDK